MTFILMLDVSDYLRASLRDIMFLALQAHQTSFGIQGTNYGKKSKYSKGKFILTTVHFNSFKSICRLSFKAFRFLKYLSASVCGTRMEA